MSPTPTRQLARRDSASTFKPYTKSATPPHDHTQCDFLAQRPGNVCVPEFPTYAQYKHIESTYLTTLNPKKREKALITQAMFDRIWDTLQDPDNRAESPQFRFWVRKMFRLSDSNDTTLFRSSNWDKENEVLLLHDNRPVAIQEQLYELICYCHSRANHGGRDRTREVVRQHYSWVPKELVAQFVKICPTCTPRRCRNSSFLPAIVKKPPHMLTQEDRDIESQIKPILDLDDGAHNYYTRPDDTPPQLSWPPALGGSSDPSLLSHHTESGLLLTSYAFIFESGKSTKESTPTHDSINLPRPSLTPTSSSSPPAQPMSSGLQSHPMSREVSLYQGLPNGWQYHSDYPEAYQAHIKGKGRTFDATEIGRRQRDKRPRIPSVAPLRDASFALLRSNSAIEPAEKTLTLPPVLKALSEGSECADDISLPPSLQNLLVFHSELEMQKPCTPQIDPVLLDPEVSSDDSQHQHILGPETEPAYGGVPLCATLPSVQATPTKSRSSRRPVPPTLDLSSVTSLDSINFEAYRPIDDATSSTSSASSCYSQLSPFPMISPSSLGEPSPSTSVLPSPSEAKTMTARELINTTDALRLGSK